MTHWPSYSRVIRQRNAMRDVVKELTDDLLVEFLKIAGESDKPLEEGPGTAVHDGYPATSSGAGDSSRGSSEHTATERAALRANRARADEDEPDNWVESSFDPIGESLKAFFAHMSEALGVLRNLESARVHIKANGQELVGRVISLQGDCECCGRSISGVGEDKRKSGFCNIKPNWCYQTWVRRGRMDRSEYVARRKRELAEEQPNGERVS